MVFNTVFSSCLYIERLYLAEKTTFNIHVATGDIKGAGTDANVYVYMFGEKNDSGLHL